MKIPLPNLDDRRWADLVDEGRALIPLYGQEWTDHNIHDPGITLMELMAWVTEMDIYRLNRITDEHRLKFLALIGITPRPPAASRAVLSIKLKQGATPRRLRATAEFVSKDPFGADTRMRTLDPIFIAPGELKEILLEDDKGFHRLTGSWMRGEPFGAFGAIPQPGAQLYLGFTEAFRRNRPVSLYFKIAGERAGDEERRRLIQEALERRWACRPPASDVPCEYRGRSVQASSRQSEPEKTPPHHGARTVWEFLTEAGGERRWVRLEPERYAQDDTRSFTLDGRVLLRVPARMVEEAIGPVAEKLFYVRCRFEAGEYDAPPFVQTVALNGVRAEQATPAWSRIEIAQGATVGGSPPAAGRAAGLRLEMNDKQQITHLRFEAPSEDAPGFRVLAYKPPAAGPGHLTIEAVIAGTGDGKPYQRLSLPEAQVQTSSLQLFTLEEGEWRAWGVRPDFESSGVADSHFLLDPTTGTLTFGDGDSGRALPRGARVFVAYRSTRAEEGNVAAYRNFVLSDSPHNRAVVRNFDAVSEAIESATNPVEATGGAAAETVDSAAARAIELMNQTRRAVTLKDHEELAKATPGTHLARAVARANLHANFPCLKAPGIVTVIILPAMPVARPMPGRGLRQAVARYLNRRRIIGTRVDVVGPRYLEVAARAKVKALPGVSRTNLRQKIIDALNEFLDPLRGGPERTGWPFGRDVYRSEVLQVIDRVAGVDHVFRLELIAEGCDAECGNVCLAPTWLVAAGDHEIEVV